MTETNYRLVASQLRQALGDETDALANAANFVAVLYNALDDVNWLGLYLARGDELVLGPFQGLAAVTRIAMGKGVCGVAAAARETQRVPDVHAFPGHIACDIASRSEIVVPLLLGDDLLGVLDIDSPSLDRFSAADQSGIEELCALFLDVLRERGATI
jgi:GAF domain-containing protein